MKRTMKRTKMGAMLRTAMLRTMMRTLRMFLVAFWMASWGLAPAAGEEKTSAALEQEYQKETNPRKQADLARKLIVRRLEELRARIGTGLMLEESSPELARYQSAVELLGSAVRAASHTGTSKNAEKLLRDQMHELEGVRMNVSASERPLIAGILAKVVGLREQVLYVLMYPPEASEKEAQGKQEAAQK